MTDTKNKQTEAELASIMGEIDALKHEMNDTSALEAEVQAMVAALPEAKASTVDSQATADALFGSEPQPGASLEETLSSLPTEEPSPDSQLAVATAAPFEASEPSPATNVTPMFNRPATTPAPSTGASPEGTLTMTLAGNMRLKLRFESGAQDVTVSFDNDAFSVTLADGSEFRVPVRAKRTVAA